MIEYSKYDDEKLLRVEQVADWLEISQSKLNKARMNGKGPPYVKIDSVVRYQAGAVRRWIADQQRTRVRMGLITSCDLEGEDDISPPTRDDILAMFEDDY